MISILAMFVSQKCVKQSFSLGKTLQSYYFFLIYQNFFVPLHDFS